MSGNIGQADWGEGADLKRSVISGGEKVSKALSGAVKEGSITLSSFYNDYVRNMIADSFLETYPKITKGEDGSVRITEVVSGRESGAYAVEIDPEGGIACDGGLEFVKSLRIKKVRIEMDYENIKFDT